MADRTLGQWVRVILQPRWIALAVFVVLFSALCWSVLAPWQLGKNTTTSARNQRIANSVNADPVPAAQLLNGKTTLPTDLEWHKVTVSGTYQNDKQVLARLRNWDGDPAYEVLTPFVASDGHSYLVDRGFVKTASGGSVPTFDPAPSGNVTLVARLRQAETTTRQPIEDGGYRQVFAIDPAAVGRTVGTTFAPGYLGLTDKQPGGLGTVPLPQLDAGPYLSYGLQWLAFGVMAPIALGYFVFSEVRRRREERAVLAAATPTEPEKVVTPEEARAARLADRYGRKG
ncbi:SURF1 family protein [Tsukamurella sp. 8F]|uniref:SURF1 family cytochrome oxidase biogenesis protein n=1 Tax=unclassified Tsukamurella TaxID=2633480 RepID=UPI0023B92F11|nr:MULTISPECIES: SURF1 family protein [unclassified Tsukamurella]MDF0529960.1 SURF1 family protein [Tsukamurella sp. 8J]MDF0587268.1 SURF1 family protein [Tsukamurella sp. 8F]